MHNWSITGTTCVESSSGPGSRTVSAGMSVTVSGGDGWDESGGTSEKGFGQERKFGGDRGFSSRDRQDRGGDRGFSSGNRSDRGGGFRNDREFGENRSGFGGDRGGGSRGFNNRDEQGRGEGFRGRQDREGGGFGNRSERGFGSGGGDTGRGGFRQSGDRDGGSRGGGFGQRSREDGGGDQGGFGGRKGFSQGGGAGRDGGGGDAGFGGNRGGFGGNKGGFGGNKGGFGGGQAAAEDDWETETTPTPVSMPTKVSSDNEKTGSQPVAVKRFRGVSAVDEDVPSDVFASLKLNIRESVDVYVVYTVNPELFYCQVIKNSSSLSELMAEMNKYYEALSESDILIERPEIGMPCAAKFSEDDTWYRAEIQTPGQKEVEVQFVDYGNTESIVMSKIRKLKPEYLKMKSQGIKCGLDGVVAQNKVWEEKSIEDFEGLTMDKHLVSKIINRSSDGTHLLELENVEEKINIGDSMCDKGHCSYVSSKISPKKDQIIESPYTVCDLAVGDELDVYVPCIENPEQFWIQPVSDEENLIAFVDGIQEFYTSGAGASMNVASVMPGQAVIALFSEDSAWYRGYVEKKGAKDAKVRFVDYGNSDMVVRESLRQPSEAMLKEPSHAAMCKLKGIRPLQTGVWTPDAKDIMSSLVSDVVKCKIIDVTGKHYTVQLTAGKTDVTEELIQAAVVRAEKEPTPPPSDSITATQEQKVKPLFFQSQVKVNIGSTEPVYVTQTDSVASFWCQLVKYYSQLDELMGTLETFCQSGKQPSDFTINMACGAKFSVDESWYRAKVTAVYPDSVEVLFVDYGNSEKVPKSDIRHLTKDLIELPVQTLHCTLENSAASTNQLTKTFRELVSDVELSMAIVEEQEDITVVQLALSGGENIAGKLELVEEKIVTASGNNENRVMSAPSSMDVIPSTPAPLDAIPTPQTYPASKNLSSSTVKVYVSEVISPGRFSVQLVDQETELNELMEQVATTYEDETKYKVNSVSNGQACCCKFSEDGSWYRAQVISVSGPDITVRFVDYGNMETTTIDKIRSFRSEIATQPPFAYSCQLAGIIPVANEWSAEVLKQFEELVVDNILLCQFVSEDTVNLSLNEEDVGEMLLKNGHVKSTKFETQVVEKENETRISYVNYKIADQCLPAEANSCYVAHVKTDGTFYVQFACEEEHLIASTESLQETAPTLPTMSRNSLKAGYFCIARYSEDQAWYRAVVELVTDASVTVRFIDYGNSDTIESDENLKCPTEQLSQAHALAYQCRLLGADISEIDIENLANITCDKELKCKFHSDVVPYVVELTDEEGQIIVDLVKKTVVSEEMVAESESKIEGTQGHTEEMTAESTTEIDEPQSQTEDAMAETKTEVEGIQSKIDKNSPKSILTLFFLCYRYSKTCVKRPLKSRQNKDLYDEW